MDFGQFDTVAASEEGVFLQLRNFVTNEPLVEPSKPGEDDNRDRRVGFTLRGLDSKNFRAHLAQANNRLIKAAVASAKRGASDQSAAVTAEQFDSDNIDRLVACFVSASNVSYGDKPVTTAGDFRTLITQQVWVREQVSEFVGTRANFLLNTPMN